jgi:two-component system KDP operon response regulator KdpE
MEAGREKSRVLVVDDEPQVTDALRGVLASDGYQVRTADEGAGALAFFNAWRPELVITDLGMAPIDGIELCRRIRAESMVPIIVVSADTGERSKVVAFDAGADDYVVKPFGPDELMARVRAALRRAAVAGRSVSLTAGDVRVDFDARRVYVGAREVRLTPKEFDLFVYLARRPNQIIPHARLLSAVWGDGSSARHESLRVFIRQLRLKLEPDPPKPRYLMTEPSVGYCFNPRASPGG